MTQTPEVRRLSVVEVRFNRGEGCCEEDPVRGCTGYYDAESGERLFIVDPELIYAPPALVHVIRRASTEPRNVMEGATDDQAAGIEAFAQRLLREIGITP